MQTPVAIETHTAPAAIGPYSQAVQAGSLVFISGQLGLDPASGQMVPGGVAAETRQALTNIKALLRATGCASMDLVKTTIFLTDMADFATVNQIYAEELAPAKPARACVAVAALPKGGLVEIEAIAMQPAT
jgi:2-iminobutanoate/2-iminopropanoate deaminase